MEVDKNSQQDDSKEDSTDVNSLHSPSHFTSISNLSRRQLPRGSGSCYVKYKGLFSVVLMALVDADYKFLFTLQLVRRHCRRQHSHACDRARDFPVLYCVVSYDAHPLHENGPSIQLCEFHVKQAFKVEVGNSGQSAE